LESGVDHFALLALAGGGLDVALPGVNANMAAGDVMAVDLSRPVSLRPRAIGEAVECVALWITRGRVLDLMSEEGSLHGLILKHESAPGALIGVSLRALAAMARRLSPRELDAMASGVLALAAHALAPALEASAAFSRAAPLASFVSIRRYIDANLASPNIGAKAIADTFGLSRATLYRLFEPAGGVALYIRKRRLDRAYREITAAGLANRRIGPIAYSLGFKNVNAFARAFRQVYGVSPMEARAQARDDWDGPAPAGGPGGERSLARVLALLR